MKIDLNEIKLVDPEEIDFVESRFPYFIPLAPAGQHSGDVEAMSSYLCRQAEIALEWSHAYSRRLLEEFVTRHELPSCRKDSADVLRLCNGIGVISTRYIEAVTTASEEKINAQFLTLYPLRFLSEEKARGLQKKYMEWCPECWRDDRAMGKSPYVRLYWLVESTKICVKHNRRLSTYCPICGDIKLQFPKFPRQWICDKCGDDLSKLDEKHAPENFTVQDAWISHAIYRLIERVYSNELILDQHIVAKSLQRMLRWSKLTLLDFCHKLNVVPRSIKNMLDTSRMPYFLAFLDLCYRMDLPPDHFLLDKDVLTSTELWRGLPKPVFADKKNLDPKKKVHIRRELKALLRKNPRPAVRVSHIARKFGISYTCLEYNFPDEYRELRARLIKWDKSYRKIRQRERLEHFVSAVLLLTKHGVYPSERKLRDLELVLPSDLRREDIKCLLKAFQEIYSGLQFN